VPWDQPRMSNKIHIEIFLLLNVPLTTILGFVWITWWHGKKTTHWTQSYQTRIWILVLYILVGMHLIDHNQTVLVLRLNMEDDRWQTPSASTSKAVLAGMVAMAMWALEMVGTLKLRHAVSAKSIPDVKDSAGVCKIYLNCCLYWLMWQYFGPIGSNEIYYEN
jgi:hypothetical protein